MPSRDDGGPAFPTLDLVRLGDRERATTAGGLTVRDYFAAKAMQGMLAYPGDAASGSWHTNAKPADVVATAYEYADAALAERAK